MLYESKYEQWRNGTLSGVENPWDDPEVWSEYLEKCDEPERQVEKEKTEKKKTIQKIKQKTKIAAFNGSRILITDKLGRKMLQFDPQSIADFIKQDDEFWRLSRVLEKLLYTERYDQDIVYGEKSEGYWNEIGEWVELEGEWEPICWTDVFSTLHENTKGATVELVSLKNGKLTWDVNHTKGFYQEGVFGKEDENIFPYTQITLRKEYGNIVINYGIKNKKGAFEAALITNTPKDKEVKKQLFNNEEKLNKFLETYYNYCIELIYAISMVFVTECKKSRLRQKKKAFSMMKKAKK